jgi:hypothetical protein
MRPQVKSGEPTTSKFVLALHDCFADHIPFSLSPEVIMSIISQEVAEYVKALEESKDSSDLPEATGESIARELERFLRRQSES